MRQAYSLTDHAIDSFPQKAPEKLRTPIAAEGKGRSVMGEGRGKKTKRPGVRTRKGQAGGGWGGGGGGCGGAKKGLRGAGAAEAGHR